MTRPHLALLALLVLPASACRPQSSTAEPRPTTATSPAEPAPRPARSKRGAAREPTQPEPSKPAAEPESGRLAGITAAHNRVREPLGLPPLTWSPELARYARTWADKLQRQGCRLKHRPRSGPDAQRHGENLFMMAGQTPTAQDVVDAWAAELKDYNPKTNRCKGVCGHYTQVVWRNSQRLGCAMAACGDTEVWVCNYDPAGNYLGERPY